MFANNLEYIREKIAAACMKAGRRPEEEVTIIAVTKTFPSSALKEALMGGIKDIGESRIQEAQEKFAQVADALSGVRKHLIGHLQTNKAKKAVELFDVIQSLDSIRLAAEINRHAERLGKVQDCLIEVKVSPEETKSGLPADETIAFFDQLKNYRHIRVRGIMTMAPAFDDNEKARPYFCRAKKIFDRVAAEPGAVDVDLLSMGMSGDFTVAVEEGATMVRIGTALFGER